MRLRLSFVAASLALLALMPGCGEGPKPIKPSATTQPKRSSKPSDGSLTAEQYAALGMPPHDRAWSTDDMQKAAGALHTLAEKDFSKLPRYQSELSGEVFARLTSVENLRWFADRSIPVSSRFAQSGQFVQFCDQIFRLYLSAFMKKAVRDCEIIEWTSAILRMTVAAIELTDEFLPTLDKQDPTYPARLQGIDRMRKGLASVVGGGLEMLTENDLYREPERLRLLDCMQATYPAIVPRMAPPARDEALARIETLAKKPGLEPLRPGLESLHAKVCAAVAGKNPNVPK